MNYHFVLVIKKDNHADKSTVSRIFLREKLQIFLVKVIYSLTGVNIMYIETIMQRHILIMMSVLPMTLQR